MIVEGYAVTDRGVAKLLNDDRVFLDGAVLSAGSLDCAFPLPLVAAVFDGVSYGGRGAEASSIASASLAAFCAQASQEAVGAEATEALARAFEATQAEVLSYAHAVGASVPVATTVSGIAVDIQGGIHGFNSGDSRVYRFRSGMLVQMTTDDTIVQSLLDNGATDYLVDRAEEADAHVITKALGVPMASGDVVCVEDFGELLPGDIYLGCTDGVSGFLDREIIKRTLSQDAPLAVKGSTLLKAALHNGSDDNVSLFVLAAREECNGECGNE